ncbi:MAG: VOC family protein [Candidatus Eremiobacteraeota bacterium]|nr:VOC family protein [Candidatus Eremiobacteraeota bacterium]MBV8433802.1 VOC family protein [Candidatus Eremiobacteraeota bacterium]MBV8583277.1 VOC family protein [Candidatus Eremiobacteraeota bacterium]
MAKFSIVMLVCGDLVRSRGFYKDVMGLRVLGDHLPRWVEFDLGDGASLGLHHKSELLAVRPGSLQLGFTVENVDKFVADCVALGVPVFQDPYDEPFGRIAVIGDPDGYPIQISAPAKK